MTTEVLKYKAEDYEVVVSCQSGEAKLADTWVRFKHRITEGADTYCDYTSSDDCQFSIYDYAEKDPAIAVIGENGRRWAGLRPVVFETCEYHLSVRFKKDVLDTTSNPKVNHPRSEVVTAFDVTKEYGSNVAVGLSGKVNFLNEPGLFKLEFAYRLKGGRERTAWVTFPVVSPKLDTKRDYKQLLREVNDEYSDIVFRYLSTTYQQLARGGHSNDVVWISVFEHIVDDYLKNVETIIRTPHQRVRHKVEYAKVDRIKRWTPAMEEEFVEHKAIGDLDAHYFRYSESEATHDTKENRFVKHTLTAIGRRLDKMFATVLAGDKEIKLSKEYRDKFEGYQKKLKKLPRHPFFRTVGTFEGMSGESLVLQSRVGYQHIYKDWILLRRGISMLDDAANNIGTLPIWEVYELWCFVKLKRILSDLLRVRDYADQELEETSNYPLRLFGSNHQDYVVRFRYPVPAADDHSEWAEQVRKHSGDVVSLIYQHTYERGKEDRDHISTVTTEQRPDIVLNLQKAKGDMLLTYLYDAKYRLKSYDGDDNEKNEPTESKSADYPPAETLNQMHRYRDAIYYYEQRNDEPSAKEIIGGYILFPGRAGTGGTPFYETSINKVNIGAFALLPTAGENEKDSKIYAHLKEIILVKDLPYNHIESALPQRGLTYGKETEDAVVIKCPPSDWQIAEKGKEKESEEKVHCYYAKLSLDEETMQKIEKAKQVKYIVLCDRTYAAIYKSVKDNGVTICTVNRVKSLGFADPQTNSSYLLFTLGEKVSLPISRAFSYVENNGNNPAFVDLKDLK